MRVQPTGGSQSSVSGAARLGPGGKLNGGHDPVCSPQSNRKPGQDDEVGLRGAHAEAGRDNGPVQSGHRLRTLQRASPAQRPELPVSPGVSATGGHLNLRVGWCPEIQGQIQ